MNSKDIRNLTEAYLSVYDDSYEGEDINEISAELATRVARKADMQAGVLSSLGSDNPNAIAKARKRRKQSIRFYDYAAKKRRKEQAIPQAESYDVYDLILFHLLDEGYASSYDAAEKIMINMSEEWRGEILEVTGGGKVAYYTHSKSGDNYSNRGMQQSPFEKNAIKSIEVDSRVGTKYERPNDRTRLKRLTKNPNELRDSFLKNKNMGLKTPPRRNRMSEEWRGDILELMNRTGFNPTNYNSSTPGEKAKHIKNQIDRLSSSDDPLVRGRAAALHIVNRWQDSPEGRNASKTASRRNKARNKARDAARARRDAQKHSSEVHEKFINPYESKRTYINPQGTSPALRASDRR